MEKWSLNHWTAWKPILTREKNLQSKRKKIAKKHSLALFTEVELFNQRIGIILATLGHGVKLLSERILQTEEAACPGTPLNLESAGPGFEY